MAQRIQFQPLYLSFARYCCGVALLLRALINMHSGSICLVDILSVCLSLSLLSICLFLSASFLPACSFHLPSCMSSPISVSFFVTHAVLFHSALTSSSFSIACFFFFFFLAANRWRPLQLSSPLIFSPALFNSVQFNAVLFV